MAWTPDLALLLAVSGVILVSCFRNHIDEWAARYIVVARRNRNAKETLLLKEFDSANEDARKIWASVLLLVVLAASYGSHRHVPCLIYSLVIVPLALFTQCAPLNQFPWVNQVAQHAFILGCLYQSPQLDSGSAADWLPFMLANFFWNEVTLQSLSSILFNHIGTTAIVALAEPNLSGITALLSAGTIAQFCWRRARPSARVPDRRDRRRRRSSVRVEDQRLATILARCAELVVLVLQSGDEICEDSKQSLSEVLGLIKGSPDHHQVRIGTGSASSNALGLGTGNGMDCTDADAEFSGCWDNLAGLTQEQDVQYVFPSWLLDERHEANGFGAKTHSAQDDLLDFMTCDKTLDESIDDLSGSEVQHTNPAWRWMEDNCALDPNSMSPKLSAAPAATPTEPAKTLTPDSAYVSKRSTEECSEVSTWLTSYFEKLVLSSFDSMAVMEPRSGAVIWANPAFKVLACCVGDGQFLEGVSVLKAQFLQQPKHELTTLHRSFGAENRLDIWSRAQLIGEHEQMRTIWILSRSGSLDPSLTQSPKCEPHQTQLVSSSAATGAAGSGSCGSPDLSNVHIKVLCDPNGPQGPRGPKVQNLWRKYGQKVLRPLSTTFGAEPASRVLDRMYYKCYLKECKARLIVDMDRATGKRVVVQPKGEHNHEVPVCTSGALVASNTQPERH
eukprot:TRINITY_DN2531_c0_g1_i2.p1 TRINITY_DN2531_c0_g1~~TRINITY_DN2531_c0_g1_i2.p1  ORF type:complete len:673 (-),score=116.26 TRINITY_DN2531_c0_g1_i2:273-2291(-)